jgi:hypothetical protein
VYTSGAHALTSGRGYTAISWDGQTLNNASVKRGIYFVQCRTNDNTVQTQKLVIQK